jgi:hypothetical protein
LDLAAGAVVDSLPLVRAEAEAVVGEQALRFKVLFL